MRCSPLAGVSVLALAATGCVTSPTSIDDPAFQRRFGDYEYCALELARQTEAFACGAACLASVLQYWGEEASEAELLAASPPADPRGYALEELHDMAEGRGLQAFLVSMADGPRGELTAQLSQGRPVICPLRYPKNPYFVDWGIYRRAAFAYGPKKDHFLVVMGLRKEEENVLVMDPAHGYAAIEWDLFRQGWQPFGYAALIISP